uniref:Uncharacterized protein n=1 Tax=Anguilla anguilla TaxID=7936 RepID=A0A0E9V1Q4_ANGAN
MLGYDFNGMVEGSPSAANQFSLNRGEMRG